MVGFQSFPSRLEDVKLEKIRILKEKYPKLHIGYADHSSYKSEYSIISNDYAYLLGATFFEKHITIDEGKERLDYQSAVGKNKLKEVVSRLTYLDKQVFRHTQELLLIPENKEIVYRNRQKVIVAAKDLKEGDVIDEQSISYKMIDKPDGEVNKSKVIGKKLKEAISQYDIITLNQLV